MMHATMREANVERVITHLADLTGDCCAATDPGNHAAALKMVTMSLGSRPSGRPRKRGGPELT